MLMVLDCTKIYFQTRLKTNKRRKQNGRTFHSTKLISIILRYITYHPWTCRDADTSGVCSTDTCSGWHDLQGRPYFWDTGSWPPKTDSSWRTLCSPHTWSHRSGHLMIYPRTPCTGWSLFALEKHNNTISILT